MDQSRKWVWYGYEGRNITKNCLTLKGTQGQVKTSTGPNTNDLRHLDSDSASDTPSTFATSKGLAEKGYQGLSDPHVVISLRDKITYLNSIFSIAC